MPDIEEQAPAPGGVPGQADEAGLRDELAQAQALLREVDHRVKNNLQLVASLLLLQSRRAEEPIARETLKTVLERLNAVTTVHRRLLHGDPQQFEVAGFIRDLVADLAAALGRDDLTISLDLDNVQVPATSAAPLALVINELIGNALKHAYPGDRGGRVIVRLRGEADGGCVLTVSDEGDGLQGRSDGFGLTVARLLCQQLHASLDLVEAGPGLKATVRAPLARIVAS
jgi:two-component sensor histidine kinase